LEALLMRQRPPGALHSSPRGAGAVRDALGLGAADRAVRPAPADTGRGLEREARGPVDLAADTVELAAVEREPGEVLLGGEDVVAREAAHDDAGVGARRGRGRLGGGGGDAAADELDEAVDVDLARIPVAVAGDVLVAEDARVAVER